MNPAGAFGRNLSSWVRRRRSYSPEPTSKRAPIDARSRRAPAQLPLVLLVALLLLTAGSPGARAGKYNKTLNIGDAAPAWSDLPGVDGKRHSLADLQDSDVVVAVFTCNSCPYAVDYEDRLNELARKYQAQAKQGPRVTLVAINVNKIPEDQLPAMIQRAQEKQFLFPYLYDESQEIATRFGAVRTPEFYVLDSERKVAYMGAMDDSPDIRKVRLKYLEDAVDAVLAGKPAPFLETPPIGCAIRYVRPRR